MKTLFLILTLLISSVAFAQGKKVAVVKIMRGEVEVITLGKTSKLKVEDWVEDGAVVKTGDKSFVKLVFIDKSQMNVGPNSEMKIEKFSGNDSGVIDLVKGKIRSQVTKDYLQMKDKDKSKLFIKTPTAVMGIRGTDFMISTNGANTAAILFEGEVVFNKLDSRSERSSERLEQIVDRGVRMFPGEFSVVEPNRPQPTVPSLLNVQQREALEKNDGFDRAPSNSGTESAKTSVVPGGLDGKAVSNDKTAVVISDTGAGANNKEGAPSSANPDGYVKGNEVKPANGSFVHVDSGVIIPPGADSVLDVNTNTYIPGPESGKIEADGTYKAPKGMEITDSGKIMIVVTNDAGVQKVVEVLPPPPVLSNTTLANTILPPPPAGAFPPPPTNTILQPTSGGITNVNDAVQQLNNGPKNRTINVNTQP